MKKRRGPSYIACYRAGGVDNQRHTSCWWHGSRYRVGYADHEIGQFVGAAVGDRVSVWGCVVRVVAYDMWRDRFLVLPDTWYAWIYMRLRPIVRWTPMRWTVTRAILRKFGYQGWNKHAA